MLLPVRKTQPVLAVRVLQDEAGLRSLLEQEKALWRVLVKEVLSSCNRKKLILISAGPSCTEGLI